MANITISTEVNRIDVYYNALSASFGNKIETIISRKHGVYLLDLESDSSVTLTLYNGVTINLSSTNVDMIDGVTATNLSILEYFESII